MLNCGSKAHMGGLYLNGYMIPKGKIEKCFRQENKQLPKSPLALLPFEFFKKKKKAKFELHAQLTLYSTVLDIFMSSALINLQMTFLSSLHINC